MYPIRIIALFQIGFQCAVDGLLRINGLLNAFPADLCQPTFHRFRTGGWDRLNNAEKLLGCGSVGLIVLSIRRFHFQLYDIFVQLSCPLGLQLALQVTPISARVFTSSQYMDYIDNREVPLLLFFIPSRANGLIFKKLNFILFAHSVAILSLSFFDYTSANSLPQELQKQLF